MSAMNTGDFGKLFLGHPHCLPTPLDNSPESMADEIRHRSIFVLLHPKPLQTSVCIKRRCPMGFAGRRPPSKEVRDEREAVMDSGLSVGESSSFTPWPFTESVLGALPVRSSA